MNKNLQGSHKLSRNENCSRLAMSQTADARPALTVRVLAGLFFIFIAGGAFCQDTGDQTALVKTTFQIADIHTSSNLSSPKVQGGGLHSGQYELREATMLDLIVTAYGVDPDTVFGGPAWLELDRFDVIAKVPPDTSLETAKAMLQELLAERFHLVVHRDTKVVPGFALSLEKSKPKLKPADASGDAGCQTSKETSKPGVAPYSIAICRNITMERFVAALRGLASADITGPVADLTHLRGNWDFDLKWTDRRLLTSTASDITLFNAISQQLGLVLERKGVRMPVLVVDHAKQKPTPNPPDTMTLLPPPPPPEFEAASIKPSAPGTRPGGGGFLPGGRVEFRGTPLALLLLTAWDSNFPPDEIPGAPKWLTPFEPTFDLFAKAPASAIASGTQLYQSDYQMMLRALLVDRFKIVSHYEDRPMNTYVLVALKPELKKADPSNRLGCKTVRSPNPRPSELAPFDLESVCKNITMTQFAQQLQIIAPVYFRYPVLDATAIVGAWDFTFTFSPIPPDLLGGGGGGLRSADPVPAAVTAEVPSNPVGGISLLDAIKKQLGLKLEVQKRPQPVLVIDHIQQKPTEN
jgi:uncharacterized protein (TIGR03435 family)